MTTTNFDKLVNRCSETLGIDSAQMRRALVNSAPATTLYIPKETRVMNQARNQQIKQSNDNARVLADQHYLSERQIHRIRRG